MSLLEAIPDETTILNFRRRIETNDLAPRILEQVNAHLSHKGLMLKRGKINVMLEGRAKRLVQKVEKAKSQIRARVEHPFRAVKRQFGFVKVRFRGLAKNTSQVITLFALSNLWMVRKQMLGSAAKLCPKYA